MTETDTSSADTGTYQDWEVKTIVAGLDGSDRSLDAAQHAVSIARRYGAHLILATVVRPPEGWWGMAGEPPAPEAFSAAIVEARQGILDRAENDLDLEGVDWETVEEVGDPAGQLAELCRTRDADLLVVGRRGAGVVERLLVGSVADRVTHIAPCPVLTIP